jgi:hypothetical protein
MDFVLRFVRSVFGGGDQTVVLRHAPSGAVLGDGEGPAVRFASEAEACAFSRRFLDEAAAWEPVPGSAYATSIRAA